MTSPNKDDKINWNLELTTNEILLPVFQPYVNELTELRWLELDPETVDETVKKIVTDLCVEIINIIAKTIFEAIQKRQVDTDNPPQAPDGPDEVQELAVSEEQVWESLGDVIPNTLSEAIGDSGYINTQSSEEMTRLMAEEITEQVNSNLVIVQDGQERNVVFTKPQPSRLKQIVAKALEMIRSIFCKWKKDQKNAVMVASELRIPEYEEEDFEMVEDVTAITSFIEEEEITTKVVSDEEYAASAKETTENILADSIKEILNEQMNSSNVFGQNNFNKEEYDELVASISLDIERVSAAISAEIIRSSLMTTSMPESRAEVKAITRKRVNRWIQALFVHRFFKESILRFVSRLKSKSPTELKQDSSPKQLFQAGEILVNSMIPQEELTADAVQPSLYEKIASGIQADEQEIIRKQLCDILLRHLQTEEQAVQNIDDIWNEVDFFMKLMWNWLNQQAQQHRTRMDSGSLALREIETAAAVALPEVTEDISLVESDTYMPEFEEEQVSIAIKPAIIKDVDVPPDEVPTQEDNKKEKLCHLLVSGLVSRILEELCVYIPLDVIKAIISKLKEMLMTEMFGCDISVRASGLIINRIIKAVLRDLFEEMGSIDVIRINLMLQEDQIYRDIIRALTKHLVAAENKSGVISSFRTVFKTMSRPFNRRE